MKKLLLTLAAVLTATGSIFAADETNTVSFDFSKQNYTNSQKITEVDLGTQDVTVKFDKGSNTSNGPTYYTSGTAVRIYTGNTLSFTGADGVSITSIKFTMGSSNNTWITGTTSTPEGFDTSANTWTGSSNSVKINIGGKSGHVRITAMELSYVKTAVSVARPTISMEDGSNLVTISAAEGAKIYYTLDGTTPDVNSTEYTAPFELTEACTITAIAKLGEDISEAATAQLYLKVVSNILEFYKNASPEATLINTPLTMIYHKNNHTMVVDATGAFGYIYSKDSKINKTFEGCTNGATWATMTATYSLNGKSTPQISPVSMGEMSDGEAVSPNVCTLSNIEDAALYTYVKLSDIKLASVTEKNMVFAEGEIEKAGYNQYAIELPDAEQTYSVTAFTGNYNNNFQIWPVLFEQSGEPVEPVEAPVFSVESGNIVIGTVVKITCPTEGASIYYTLDDSDPDTSSTAYTEDGIAFNEPGEYNLKAIAAKGDQISPVAIASYIVEDPDAKVITAKIIFAEQNWETGSGKLYKSDNTVDWTARNGKVFSTSATSQGSNYPAYFTTGDKGLRLYGSAANQNVITVNAPRNFILVSVTTDNVAKFNGSETATAANELFTDFGEHKTSFTFAAWATKTVAYTEMTIVLEAVETGVNEIIDNSDAPVRYFNLQGVEVANPADGLYIRVQGKKAEKVIF